MRTEVTGKHLDITPAIEAYAAEKAGKLTKHFNGVQLVRFILEQLPRAEFAVEVCVDAVKHDTFVARAHGTDLYHCIDQAVEKAARQLTDFKEKLKDPKR